MSRSPVVLTLNAVAAQGADGLAGDVAVFGELDCRAVSVATAVLAASGTTIHACEALPAETVAKQLAAAVAGGRPAAARLGMVASAEQAEALAPMLRRDVPIGLVYAPVVRLAGATVLDQATLEAVQKWIFPEARAIVVRASDLDAWLGEAAAGIDGIRAAARELRGQGARAVVVAGLVEGDRVVDVVDDDGRCSLFDTARLRGPHVAGLSGAFSAAMAAHLAHGLALIRAVEAAQRYVALRLVRGR